jgi:hypothetical protein
MFHRLSLRWNRTPACSTNSAQRQNCRVSQAQWFEGGCIDDKTNEWMIGWMDCFKGRWTDGFIIRQMDRFQYLWADRETGSQMIGLMAAMRDGKMDEFVDSQQNGLIQWCMHEWDKWLAEAQENECQDMPYLPGFPPRWTNSVPGLIKWDLWWTKLNWGRFSPSASVFPCQFSYYWMFYITGPIIRGRISKYEYVTNKYKT